MYSKVKIIAISIIAIVLVYCCSVALKVPTVTDANISNIPLDTLIKGREMYIGNCASCHSLYLPERYTKAEWVQSMHSMKKRAKINDNQSATILKYLSVGSKKENQ